MRKHSHSCWLNTCGVLDRSFVSRTATPPPSGRCAISTHPPVLLALLLNQRSPVRSVSIRLSFRCVIIFPFIRRDPSPPWRSDPLTHPATEPPPVAGRTPPRRCALHGPSPSK